MQQWTEIGKCKKRRKERRRSKKGRGTKGRKSEEKGIFQGSNKRDEGKKGSKREEKKEKISQMLMEVEDNLRRKKNWRLKGRNGKPSCENKG